MGKVKNSSFEDAKKNGVAASRPQPELKLENAEIMGG
jgi:hypothetical protein